MLAQHCNSAGPANAIHASWRSDDIVSEKLSSNTKQQYFLYTIAYDNMDKYAYSFYNILCKLSPS